MLTMITSNRRFGRCDFKLTDDYPATRQYFTRSGFRGKWNYEQCYMAVPGHGTMTFDHICSFKPLMPVLKV